MTPSIPDMGAVGEAASKFTNPQTVMFYFLLVLIVAFMVERAWAGWRHGRTADKFANAATKLGEVIKADAVQITVNQALLLNAITETERQLRRNRETLEQIQRTLTERMK